MPPVVLVCRPALLNGVGCAASLGMNGESTQRQSVVEVAYIACLIHSCACNKDRTTGGCPVKRQVSSRLGGTVLSVTLTELLVIVSLWCEPKFQP